MENKKKFLIALILVDFISLIFCIGGNFYILTFDEFFPFLHIGASMIIISMFMAGAYAFCGYRKSGARFFKYFMTFYTLAEFSSVLYAVSLNYNRVESNIKSMAGIIVDLVIYGLLVALSVGKDLGKKRSYIYCISILVLNVLMFAAVIALKSSGDMLTENQSTIFMWYAGSNVALSLSFFTMMIAKYTDKAMRKTV